MTLTLDIQVDDDAWDDEATQKNAAACADAVWTSAAAGVRPGEVSLLFTSDDAVHILNKDWRGKDKPTNVLSFPADPMPRVEGVLTPLGDLALAHGVCAQEAAQKNIPLEHHLSHLIVHGLLHLFGYDHIDETQAGVMEALERDILHRLGIPDPYADAQ